MNILRDSAVVHFRSMMAQLPLLLLLLWVAACCVQPSISSVSCYNCFATKTNDQGCASPFNPSSSGVTVATPCDYCEMTNSTIGGSIPTQTFQRTCNSGTPSSTGCTKSTSGISTCVINVCMTNLCNNAVAPWGGGTQGGTSGGSPSGGGLSGQGQMTTEDSMPPPVPGLASTTTRAQTAGKLTTTTVAPGNAGISRWETKDLVVITLSVVVNLFVISD